MTEPLNLGFDTQAFVKPKTRADTRALFDEALSLLRDLNDQFDDLFTQCGEARQTELHGPHLPMAKETYTYGSMRKTAQEWADYFGVTFQYLYAQMMVNGWSYERAVELLMKKKTPL